MLLYLILVIELLGFVNVCNNGIYKSIYQRRRFCSKCVTTVFINQYIKELDFVQCVLQRYLLINISKKDILFTVCNNGIYQSIYQRIRFCSMCVTTVFINQYIKEGDFVQSV